MTWAGRIFSGMAAIGYAGTMVELFPIIWPVTPFAFILVSLPVSFFTLVFVYEALTGRSIKICR